MWDGRILFIDAEALVIDKPAGLAVHGGPKTRHSLEDHLPDLRFGFHRPPAPVHRLDRDTSGCLLLSRNPKAHKRFAKAFYENRVAKAYLAVLDGVPKTEVGLLHIALKKVSSVEQGWRMVPHPDGQRAVTTWKLLEVRNGRALVAFWPQTGRTHQLRVHAVAGIGFPIVGDPVYGRGEGPMLLHSHFLEMERAGKDPVKAVAAVPRTFVDAGFDDAAY